MQFYLAPLEGITGYIYRNAYHRHFRPMDKYFTPFLVPHSKRGFNAREMKEILPEHNEGLYVVPQILSNNAADCLQTIGKLKQFGYEEINLNMGCPSRTVVSKYRGSGFLARPEALDAFLEEVFAKADVKISVKTRIGRDEPEEFYEILDIYNKYPMEELIIHPRVQKDFYKNHPNLSMYEYAVKESRNPLCYNGDLFSAEDYERFTKRFPQTEKVMLGRGIIRNPGLVDKIENSGEVNAQKLRGFHDEVYEGYREISAGDKQMLFKMKEFWSYMIELFPECKKTAKKIKKAETVTAYEAAVKELFSLLS